MSELHCTAPLSPTTGMAETLHALRLLMHAREAAPAGGTFVPEGKKALLEMLVRLRGLGLVNLRTLSPGPGCLPRRPFEFVLAADLVGQFLLRGNVRMLDVVPLVEALRDAAEMAGVDEDKIAEALRAAYVARGCDSTWADVVQHVQSRVGRVPLLTSLALNDTLAITATSCMNLALQREASYFHGSTQAGRANVLLVRAPLPSLERGATAYSTLLERVADLREREVTLFFVGGHLWPH